MSGLAVTVKNASVVGSNDRNKRLLGNYAILYHATSVEAAKAISKYGFERGSEKCLVGSAIYMAYTPEEAVRKAEAPSATVVFQCIVLLGKEMKNTKEHFVSKNLKYSFASLQETGHDSVHVTKMLTGDEVAVYNYDQVVAAVVHSGQTVPNFISSRKVPREFWERYTVTHKGTTLSPN
eukprot:TRINITY_DN1802_c0_g1_i3.p1 TRINITY_DN1802_c0_g1~~TRINITY_DN1802_c0_g1_i3.p1  ORF type:complete len:196 (+),score=50.91 TRINITY_DN1802_c0_g1_i3:54-590(+)